MAAASCVGVGPQQSEMLADSHERNAVEFYTTSAFSVQLRTFVFSEHFLLFCMIIQAVNEGRRASCPQNLCFAHHQSSTSSSTLSRLFFDICRLICVFILPTLVLLGPLHTLLLLRQERQVMTFKGLSTLVPQAGDFVSGNRRFCCRKRRQSRMFPDTKSPVSRYKVPFSGTSVDRPLGVIHFLLYQQTAKK